MGELVVEYQELVITDGERKRLDVGLWRMILWECLIMVASSGGGAGGLRDEMG